MKELETLKKCFNWYVKSRDKEEREQIKQLIEKTLESINQGAVISNIELDRNNLKINYNMLPKYSYTEINGYFSFSNAANKYYINGLHFTA